MNVKDLLLCCSFSLSKRSVNGSVGRNSQEIAGRIIRTLVKIRAEIPSKLFVKSLAASAANQSNNIMKNDEKHPYKVEK